MNMTTEKIIISWSKRPADAPFLIGNQNCGTILEGEIYFQASNDFLTSDIKLYNRNKHVS